LVQTLKIQHKRKKGFSFLLSSTAWSARKFLE